MPRTGSDFASATSSTSTSRSSSGCRPTSQRTSIFVGKIDSVIGIEYRERKSDQRFGITPSLIARYTTGTALGVKVRSKFGDGDWLVLAAALTNGSYTTEQFHFYDEIDSNAGKTASGRLSVRLRCRSATRDRRLGQLRRAGPRARQPRTRCGSSGVDLLVHIAAASTSRRSGCTGARRRRARPQGVYGLRPAQRRLPRGRLRC